MYLAKTTKSPYYQIVFFIDGKKTSVSTKTASKQKAQKFLESFRARLDEENSRPVGKKPIILLREFLTQYLERASLYCSASYCRCMRSSFKMLTDEFGNIKLDDISPRMLEKYLFFRYSNHKYAAALDYRILKGAFNKAVQWDYINDNPLRKVKLARIPKTFPVFICKEELQKITDKTEKTFLKNLFIFAFNTGMRLGEIVHLRWNSVDLYEAVIKVESNNEFTTKSRRSRTIPINKTILSMLKDIKARNTSGDYVFSRSGIRLNEDFVSKQFKKAATEAEVNERVHFHTLRHSFASSLVQKGVSLYEVKELLGHENITTTQIYAHLKKDNLVSAVELLC